MSGLFPAFFIYDAGGELVDRASDFRNCHKNYDNGLEGIIGETSGGGKPSRGEETVCGDEENAVEEGQHGPLRVITDRKGRKGGRLPPSSRVHS